MVAEEKWPRRDLSSFWYQRAIIIIVIVILLALWFTLLLPIIEVEGDYSAEIFEGSVEKNVVK